jgi:protein-S-isoprenylcysteine O-methyltransferase Ste14
MRIDWHEFVTRRPRLGKAIIVLKRIRTKAAIALVALSTIEAFWDHERPYDWDEQWRSVPVIVGLLLIAGGTAFRLWAYGHLQKKDHLARSGPYALCRHPLYLGSITLAYGFCFLLRDDKNFIAATAYFLVFYTIAIIWEEVRLGERYGDEHACYAAETPLLIPMGTYRSGAFSLALAMRNQGLVLVVLVVSALAGVELMAEYMPR